MFRRLLNGQSKSITSAALIIGAASLTSRVLGFLRDRVLAGEFGAGSELDTYYAAFRLPDFVFNLLILGALSAGFIPIFTGYISHHKNKAEAWRLVNNLLHILIIALLCIFAILFFAAPWVMKLLAPGFSGPQLAEATALTRIMFLSPLFLGISGLLGGILQSFKRFFVYSLAPIFYNIGIIVGALYLVPWLGIYGLAWGVVLGAFLHMLVQLPNTFVLGYRYRPVINIFDAGFRRIIRMMVPRTLSLAISQINLLIVVIIGSTLAQGSITIFNFAVNIQSFPLGIFALSFAIAAFPTLSEQVKTKTKFLDSFTSTLNQILFFIIPSSALLIVLRAQIVRVVLGAGRFNWEDTILTMDALALFSLSLFAQGLIPLFARAFFAQHDSKTPFYTGLFSAVLNVILSIFFARTLGVAGLALAFSLSNIVQLVLLWAILRNRFETLNESKIMQSLIKISVAAFLMVFVVQGTKYLVEPIFGTQTFLGIFLQGAAAGITGIIAYAVICITLKSPESQILVNSIKKRLFKKYKPTEIIQE